MSDIRIAIAYPVFHGHTEMPSDTPVTAVLHVSCVNGGTNAHCEYVSKLLMDQFNVWLAGPAKSCDISIELPYSKGKLTASR